jgi:hypothetical protein
MKVTTLTSPQRTQAATNKAALATASAALSTANNTQANYLASVCGCKNPRKQHQLSDDGASIVCQ